MVNKKPGAAGAFASDEPAPPQGARAVVQVTPKLRGVFSGFNGKPVLVDCGGEAGVTLLVTHV